jgi:hypothetical protein
VITLLLALRLLSSQLMKENASISTIKMLNPTIKTTADLLLR